MNIIDIIYFCFYFIEYIFLFSYMVYNDLLIRDMFLFVKQRVDLDRKRFIHRIKYYL